MIEALVLLAQLQAATPAEDCRRACEPSCSSALLGDGCGPNTGLTICRLRMDACVQSCRFRCEPRRRKPRLAPRGIP